MTRHVDPKDLKSVENPVENPVEMPEDLRARLGLAETGQPAPQSPQETAEADRIRHATDIGELMKDVKPEREMGLEEQRAFNEKVGQFVNELSRQAVALTFDNTGNLILSDAFLQASKSQNWSGMPSPAVVADMVKSKDRNMARVVVKNARNFVAVMVAILYSMGERDPTNAMRFAKSLMDKGFISGAFYDMMGDWLSTLNPVPDPMPVPSLAALPKHGMPSLVEMTRHMRNRRGKIVQTKRVKVRAPAQGRRRRRKDIEEKWVRLRITRLMRPWTVFTLAAAARPDRPAEDSLHDPALPRFSRTGG